MPEHPGQRRLRLRLPRVRCADTRTRDPQRAIARVLSSGGVTDMAGGSKDEGSSVTAKVIAIMCAFVHREELSNLEISRLSGLPASTTHRLLAQLVLGGLLERTSRKQYRI